MTAALPRRHAALGGALAFGGVTIVLDTTITVLAVPVLVRVFDAPLASVQWVSTAYVLALVATMPLAAWLGARCGFRRTYVAALLVFAAASVWAGTADSLGVLVAARVVQGLGGGLINPLGMTIGLRGVPAASRGRVAALLGLPVMVGPLVGPVLAGWLIDTVSWRAIFFVTVAPALLAATLVFRLAPAEPARDRSVHSDPIGALLLVPGAVGIVYGTAQAGAPVAERVALVLAGCGLIGLFVRRSVRSATPLLDVRLLRDPAFASAVCVLVLFAAAYFGSMTLTPTYVQVTRGASAITAGSLGIPAGLATGLSLQLATRLVDRLPARRVICSGLAVAALASLAGILVLRADTPFWVLALLGAVLGAGAGGVLMPASTTATRALDGSRLASGASILGLSQQLANAVGTAAITAVFSAAIAWRAPAAGGLAGISRMSPPARQAVAGQVVDAQRITQCLTLALILAAFATAAWLLRPRPAPVPASTPLPTVAGAR